MTMEQQSWALKCEKERCIKHSFDTDVLEAYDADKDFVQSFMHGLLLEATMNYFEMESANDKPSTNCQPPSTVEEQNDWVQKYIGAIIDKYVFLGWSGNDAEPVETIGDYSIKSSTSLYPPCVCVFSNTSLRDTSVGPIIIPL